VVYNKLADLSSYRQCQWGPSQTEEPRKVSDLSSKSPTLKLSTTSAHRNRKRAQDEDVGACCENVKWVERKIRGRFRGFGDVNAK